MRSLLPVAIIFLLLSMLQLFTPFTFSWRWLTVGVYIVTVVVCFFAANIVRQKLLSSLLKYVPLLCLCFVLLTSMMLSPYGNSFTIGWKTAFIQFRNTKDPQIYIAEQMIDLGGLGYRRRTVKVVELTAVASWVTPYKDPVTGPEWRKVNEDLNPFNLKY